MARKVCLRLDSKGWWAVRLTHWLWPTIPFRAGPYDSARKAYLAGQAQNMLNRRP